MPNLYCNREGLFKLKGLGWSPNSVVKQSKSGYVKVARESFVKKKSSMVRLPKMVDRSLAECSTKSKYGSIVRRNHFLYNRQSGKDSEAFKSFRGILNRLFRIKFDD